MRPRALPLLALMALAAIAALSAEQAPRRLVVALEAKAGSYTGLEAMQLVRSLATAIQGSGAEILLLDWGTEPFPVDDPSAASKAVKRTGDCWLHVLVDGTGPTLTVRSYDLLLDRMAIEETIGLGQAFELPDPPAATWQKLVDLLIAAYPPVDTAEPLKSTAASRPSLWTKDRSKLAIRAVPGSIIEGLEGQPRTVGEDGALVETVRSPATYILRATLDGYLPAELRVYLDDDREVTMPQVRAARFAFEGGLSGLAFPQVDASLFIVPGWLYARVGIMSYLGGLAFSDEAIFWSRPLTTVMAQIGTYALLPQESPFRPYVAAGALLRVAHPLGTPPVFIDGIAPWGVQLILGFDASPWPHSRFFAEWSPTEYVTPYPDLFRAALGSDYPDSIVFLPFGVLDLGLFRLGWRWML